ncbi:MAG: hypothetical protein JXR51_16390 [Bacteroidales bacterium]|nr:hypothetical protein [Bacteroidales bacterium]MBN2758746.1 hypothetical protein [Bacteroidales bacterium]
MKKQKRAIFLHHSTGSNIWKGNVSKYSYKLFKEGDVLKWIKKYNKKNKTDFKVEEKAFPKKQPYGWKNMPFDYYNIWVKNGGNELFMEEPTLEILSKKYELIIWKHCYPVSAISKNKDTADINSEERTVENYKLQYIALKEKMHEFPETKFLVWTGATHVKGGTNEESAKRMNEFVNWVRAEWNEKGDNIFLWDFYELETEGGIYLKDDFAESLSDSHPNKIFSGSIAPYFGQRIVDVLSGLGDEKPITGKY